MAPGREGPIPGLEIPASPKVNRVGAPVTHGQAGTGLDLKTEVVLPPPG